MASSDAIVPEVVEGQSPLSKHAKRVTDRAVEEALGDKASPELRAAASKALAPWAEKFVVFLDETLRVPGTNIKIGLDPIIGFLVPGAGDAITGTGSIALLFLALKERVPTIAILRMLMNIAIDTVLGVLPILGDAFDLFFRSNRRNLEIIQKYKGDPDAKPSPIDYVLVAVGVLMAIASILVPVFVIYGLGASVIYGIWRAITG